MKYALDNGASIIFQRYRKVDDKKDRKFTNDYTINTLFPNIDPLVVLKDELRKLTINEYIQTVKDLSFPNRSEMRVFGKNTKMSKMYI